MLKDVLIDVDSDDEISVTDVIVTVGDIIVSVFVGGVVVTEALTDAVTFMVMVLTKVWVVVRSIQTRVDPRKV